MPLNRDIATIHSNIVQEYNTLKGYSWKWLGGVSVAFLVMFCVLGWGMKTILDRNYNATAAVYQKVVTLEDKLVEKPVTGEEPEKLTRFACPTPHDPRKDFANRSPFFSI